MPEAFDPYLRWLGIRDPGRPPNHYRLLGLDLFENDSDVIAVAADRQMAHVRTFQTGQFAPLSQRVLNELAAARICLLKPEKKAVYDALLKKQLGAVAVAGRAKPQSDTAPIPAAVADNGTRTNEGRQAASEELLDFASIASATGPSRRAGSIGLQKSAAAARKPKSLAPWIGLAVAGFLLVVGVIAVQQMGGSPEVATTDGPKKMPDASVTSTTAPPRPVQPKADTHKKPVPAIAPQPHRPEPAVVPADHGTAATPTDVRPTASTFAPKPSPPEPPVHSPGDVIRVENPVQPNPASSGPAKPAATANASTEVAQVDGRKPGPNGGSKPDGQDHETQSTPKNPASPTDQAADSKPKRAPVPSKEQIAAAEAKVQKLFNVSAAKKPDERAALAKTLFTEGIDPNNQAVDRYVLLRMAMKGAETLGDADLAIKAADKLGEKFDVNSLEEKVGVLAALGKTVRTASAAQVVLGAAQEQLESALTADDFETAKSLAQLAAGLAAKSGDAALARQMRQRSAEIDQIRKEYAKASPARDTLKTTPDDPEANYVWGYYVGPIKGDFDRGLPYLAKGNYKRIAEMAKKELADPKDPKSQAALADGWLDFSNNEREPARARLRSHAAEWYSQAAGKLTGLEKKRVEDQLAKLEPAAKNLAINGADLTKILTGGAWTVHWFANPGASVEYAKHDVSYRRLVFLQDGTCFWENAKGTWTVEGRNAVVVRYPTSPTCVQRFTLRTGGTIDCEHFDPATVLQQRGVGTELNGAKSN